MHVVCYHTGGVATLLVANYWKPKLRNNFSHNTTYIVLLVTLLEVEVHFKPLEGLLSFSLNINRNYHYVTDTDKFTFIGIDFSSNVSIFKSLNNPKYSKFNFIYPKYYRSEQKLFCPKM